MKSQAQEGMSRLLRIMVEKQASDLHLEVGHPPTLRIKGEIVPLNGHLDGQPLEGSELQEMLYSIISPQQRERFETEKELDFALRILELSRFRCNILYQQGTIASAIRAIPEQPPSLSHLGFAHLQQFCKKPRGLVLVVGPTGAGKSTTLAAMIDYINENYRKHIITIEDPIEYVHRNKQSIVWQRELGQDTLSFASALKRVLRQDPDVILVGEMRDLETIALAITAAETGHLVFATMHTMDCAQTVDRIIDVFPPHQQQQVRSQLAGMLEGVISQALLPSKSGNGRVCAMEVLVATHAIRSLIRTGKTHEIPSAIQTGAKHGMKPLHAALVSLVLNEKVSYEVALEYTSDPQAFTELLKQQRPAEPATRLRINVKEAR